MYFFIVAIVLMVYYLFLFIASFLIGKLADSGLDVATELFRTLHDLYLLGFLGGIGVG